MEYRDEGPTPQDSEQIDTHRAISLHLSTQSSLTTDATSITPPPQNAQPGSHSFAISMIKPLFNTTELEVLGRIKSCLVPHRSGLEPLTQRPDLYGPFWIIATLCVSLSLFGNVSQYLYSKNSEVVFKTGLIRKAIVILYGYAVGVPFSLSLLGKALGFRLDLAEGICLYGYSMTSCVIVSALCVVPSTVLQWILMCYGFATSSILVVSGLRETTSKLDSLIQYILFGAICVCQLSLFITIKLVFLNLGS